MSNIYLLNLNNLEFYDDYKKLVSNRCIEKAEKFQLIDDAKRTIGAELIVRYLLKKNMVILILKLNSNIINLGNPI